MYPPPHPSQPQISHSSVPSSQQYQSHQTSYVPPIAYNIPQSLTQPLTEFPQMDSGHAVLVFNQGDDPIACLKGDPGIPDDQAAQTTIPNTTAFQTKDLDVYDSDCDDVSNAMMVLMANLSNYGSEVPHFEPYHTDMDNQSVHAMKGFEQTQVADFTDNKITSDRNIIPYSQYLQETQQEAVQDTNLYAQQDLMILSIIDQMSEQMINHVNNWEKANHEKNNESLTVELERYKERVKTFEQCLNINLSTHEKMIDSQMDDMIKEKLALKLEQNLSNQRKEKEYLLQTFTSCVDDEEKSILEEVSTIKNCLQTKRPMSRKEVNTTPINYVKLNRLSEDFGKRFVLQQELSDEQAFWLHTSHPKSDQSTLSPVQTEAPKELPKVSLVNTSLKKLKYHLGQFDDVVKKRITPDAITEGEWGFEHTKTVFLNEIIPFLKTLKDIFNVFDKDLLNEVTEVQTVFNQMEAVVQQYFVDKQCFEIHKKELFLENDRLLQKIMSQDVMICVMNSTAVFDDVNVEMQSSESCVKCLNLDAELLNKQNAYNDLSKSYSQLEKHCISLELTMQLNQEIFQKDSLSNNQNALEIPEYFENNDLKAQLQAKDTTICKLKEHIKTMRENDKEEKVKHEMDEIETINIELEHSVAKLLSENERLHKEIEHLKKIYKDQFDSIKKTCALSK
ncbi:hypothetical protein Tco_1156394 [Tanacetum coccineum]